MASFARRGEGRGGWKWKEMPTGWKCFPDGAHVPWESCIPQRAALSNPIHLLSLSLSLLSILAFLPLVVILPVESSLVCCCLDVNVQYFLISGCQQYGKKL